MYVPESEDEQLEQLKSWLRDYGPSFIVGVVLAIAIGFGWNYWQQRQLRTSQSASIEYTQVLNAVVQDNISDARSKAEHIMSAYKKTPYALWSAMTLAKLDINENKFPEAKLHLQWVIDNAHDSAIKQTARIRLAKIFIAEKQTDTALNLLKTVDNATFDGLTQDTTGDAYLAKGDKTAAAAAYQKAIKALNNQGITPPSFLTMKLQNLDSIQG